MGRNIQQAFCVRMHFGVIAHSRFNSILASGRLNSLHFGYSLEGGEGYSQIGWCRRGKIGSVLNV